MRPTVALDLIHIHIPVNLRTQFEIECRCGGHSVTKKFKTILQILLAKPKLWKIYIFISNTFSMLKFTFFLLKSWKMLLAVPKNGQF